MSTAVLLFVDDEIAIFISCYSEMEAELRSVIGYHTFFGQSRSCSEENGRDNYGSVGFTSASRQQIWKIHIHVKEELKRNTYMHLPTLAICRNLLTYVLDNFLEPIKMKMAGRYL